MVAWTSSYHTVNQKVNSNYLGFSFCGRKSGHSVADGKAGEGKQQAVKQAGLYADAQPIQPARREDDKRRAPWANKKCLKKWSRTCIEQNGRYKADHESDASEPLAEHHPRYLNLYYASS
jgi:hypothetical protein